jgi:hypothetical protein
VAPIVSERSESRTLWNGTVGCINQSSLRVPSATMSSSSQASTISSGGVVLDAMSYGLPVVCFDLGRPGVLVTENSGIVVTTAHRSRQQLVARVRRR